MGLDTSWALPSLFLQLIHLAYLPGVQPQTHFGTASLSETERRCFQYNFEYIPAIRGTKTKANSLHRCRELCRHMPGCAVFTFWPYSHDCHFGDKAAELVETQSRGIAGRAVCPSLTAEPSPVCSTELPKNGFPGSSAKASQNAWPSGRQPYSLECWRMDFNGGYLPCTEVTVLEDTETGWPGTCTGLVKNKLTSGDCKGACFLHPSCATWAVDKSGSCWHGVGKDCWGHRKKPPQRAQRIQQGSVRVLMNLVGWHIKGLRRIFVNDKGYFHTRRDAIAACKNVCYSNIRCQYWQYMPAYGCWIEDPREREKPMPYPLTLGSAKRSSPMALDCVDGEYIQHICSQDHSIHSPPSVNAGQGRSNETGRGWLTREGEEALGVVPISTISTPAKPPAAAISPGRPGQREYDSVSDQPGVGSADHDSDPEKALGDNIVEVVVKFKDIFCSTFSHAEWSTLTQSYVDFFAQELKVNKDRILNAPSASQPGVNLFSSGNHGDACKLSVYVVAESVGDARHVKEIVTSKNFDAGLVNTTTNSLAAVDGKHSASVRHVPVVDNTTVRYFEAADFEKSHVAQEECDVFCWVMKFLPALLVLLCGACFCFVCFACWHHHNANIRKNNEEHMQEKDLMNNDDQSMWDRESHWYHQNNTATRNILPSERMWDDGLINDGAVTPSFSAHPLQCGGVATPSFAGSPPLRQAPAAAVAIQVAAAQNRSSPSYRQLVTYNPGGFRG